MKKNIFKILIFLFTLALPISSQAALLYFNPDEYELGLESTLRVDVLVDTQDQIINAFEGEIYYSRDLLDLIDIKENNSIIDFWIDQPFYDNKLLRVYFSGIVPGGFEGNSGQLFSLYFKTKGTGQAELGIDNARVLLNDGFGTEASLSLGQSYLDIKGGEDQVDIKVVEIKDSNPPEEFWPIITQLPEVAGDQFVLVFSTKDKSSGVDYYQVKEGWGFYKDATSPYILENQALDVDIYVKAVDKNGNERVAKVSAKYPKSWYEKINISVIILLLVVVIFFIAAIKVNKWRKTKNKKQK